MSSQNNSYNQTTKGPYPDWTAYQYLLDLITRYRIRKVIGGRVNEMIGGSTLKIDFQNIPILRTRLILCYPR